MAWCCLELMSKRAYALVIAATCLADLAVCIIVFLIGEYDDKEAHDKDRYAASVSDTLTCCIARLILFPLLAFIAFQVYHRTASSSPIVRLRQQAQQQRQQQQAAATAPASEEAEGAGLNVPLNALNGSASDSLVSSSSTSATVMNEKEEAKAAFERKQEHALAMKRADRKHNVVLALFFFDHHGDVHV